MTLQSAELCYALSVFLRSSPPSTNGSKIILSIDPEDVRNMLLVGHDGVVALAANVAPVAKVVFAV
jgi:hypothetical protein